MDKQKGYTLSEQRESKGLAPILIILLIALAVGGILLYQKQPKPMSVSQPSSSPVASSAISSADITNWKTYTNGTYKFSLKYPPNYSIEEQTTVNAKLFSAIIKNPNPNPGGGYPQPLVEAVVFKNDASNLNDWLNKHITSLPFDDPSVSQKDSPFFYRGIINKKESILDGRKAVTFESTAFETSPNPILTLRDNYIVGLSFDNENEPKDPSLKDIYPTILSTFRFN